VGKINEAVTLLRHICGHPRNRRQPWRGIALFLGWQAWKRLVGRPITVKVGRQRRFLVVPDSPFSSQVVYTGLPDWDEMNFLLRYLRPEDRFLDLGANVGFYTVLAATVIERGRIFSVEASPRNVEILRRQVEINGLAQVEVMPFAVGREDGTVRFATAQREMGSIVEEFDSSVGTMELPCRKLDTLLAASLAAGEEIALAKMDVEGCEMLVLDGAPQLLGRRLIRAWLFELGEGALRAHGYAPRDLLERFRQSGYSIHTWDEAGRELNPYDAERDTEHFNLIACLDAAETRQRLGLV
jgi:FkbM family methyltransferase